MKSKSIILNTWRYGLVIHTCLYVCLFICLCSVCLATWYLYPCLRPRPCPCPCLCLCVQCVHTHTHTQDYNAGELPHVMYYDLRGYHQKQVFILAALLPALTAHEMRPCAPRRLSGLKPWQRPRTRVNMNIHLEVFCVFARSVAVPTFCVDPERAQVGCVQGMMLLSGLLRMRRCTAGPRQSSCRSCVMRCKRREYAVHSACVGKYLTDTMHAGLWSDQLEHTKNNLSKGLQKQRIT